MAGETVVTLVTKMKVVTVVTWKLSHNFKLQALVDLLKTLVKILQREGIFYRHTDIADSGHQTKLVILFQMTAF